MPWHVYYNYNFYWITNIYIYIYTSLAFSCYLCLNIVHQFWPLSDLHGDATLNIYSNLCFRIRAWWWKTSLKKGAKCTLSKIPWQKVALLSIETQLADFSLHLKTHLFREFGWGCLPRFFIKNTKQLVKTFFSLMTCSASVWKTRAELDLLRERVHILPEMVWLVGGYVSL